MTNRLNTSLACGVLCAALLVTGGNIHKACTMIISKGIGYIADVDTIYLYLLLICISSLVVLLGTTGSAVGGARILGKKIRDKKSVEIGTFFLSVLLSIDDYLSILTVGFVMSPVADRLHVARTKLAYIIRALAGPLVVIIPISTWAAAILAQLDTAGIGNALSSKIIGDPFCIYLSTIPFVFYSLFTIISVWFVIGCRISFGPIRQDEINVLVDDEHEEQEQQYNPHSLTELFMPIIILVMGVFVGILYSGGYYLLGGHNSFIEAFRENENTFLVLFLASFNALIMSIMLSVYKNLITIKELPSVVGKGFLLIWSSLVMIALATLLGSFLRIELQTGSYVAYVLLGTTPAVCIPLLLFIVSLAITLATGSAWGTFSLLIPITTQMLLSFFHLQSPLSFDLVPLLFPSLGAVLSGAVCGNHISPIADTTVLTATSMGINPLDHIRTQMAYIVPVIIGSAFSFLAAGIFSSYGVWVSCLSSIAIGLTVIILLFLLGSFFYKEEKRAVK